MNRTWKIIVSVIITTIIVGGGVYMWQRNTDKQPTQEIADVETTTTETESTNQTPKVELNTYNNTELGISFQYPTQWGNVWENKYKNTDSIAIKFKKENGEYISNIQLSPDDLTESTQFRTCEDILKNGYNSGDKMAANCETLIVDDQTVNISLFKKDRYSSSDSKQAQILTKKGVWFVTVTDESYYNNFTSLVESLKFGK